MMILWPLIAVVLCWWWSSRCQHHDTVKVVDGRRLYLKCLRCGWESRGWNDLGRAGHGRLTDQAR